MKSYYVLVQAMSRNYCRLSRKEIVKAESLQEACDKVCAKYKNLGITPTAVSMCWLLWPQP